MAQRVEIHLAGQRVGNRQPVAGRPEPTRHLVTAEFDEAPGPPILEEPPVGPHHRLAVAGGEAPEREAVRRAFNDAIFVKQPGLGGSVSWHQDGVTHWGSPDWDEGIHGFNFQVQLYPTTPASCLWVVPGSHKLGTIDIKARVEANGGSEKLPGALPLVCDAGDVTIVNRQMLHASFANTSSDLRISLTFGFHRRKSVEGQKGALGVEADEVVYDAQRIFDRSSVIAVAIDARRQHRPGEPSFVYEPFVGLEDDFRFNDETFDRVIRDYNLNDLAI